MRHLVVGPGRHTHPHAGGPTVGTLTRVSQRHSVEWRVLHPMTGVPVHVQCDLGRGEGGPGLNGTSFSLRLPRWYLELPHKCHCPLKPSLTWTLTGTSQQPHTQRWAPQPALYRFPSTHIVSRRQGALACVSPGMVRIVGSMCFRSLSFAVFSVSGQKETAITYSNQTPVPYCQRSLVAKFSAMV